MHFPDPTVVDKLHLQLAIVEERYADALKPKDKEWQAPSARVYL